MIWAHLGASTPIITVAESQDYFAFRPRVRERMGWRPLIEFSLAPNIPEKK